MAFSAIERGEDMENFNIGRKAGSTPLGDERITMTYSGVFTRGGEKVVHVCFERKQKGAEAFAEAVIPACTFLHNKGFGEEETEALRVYLQMNWEQIFNEARGINRSVFFKL